jgi:hypothetical protein
LPTAGGCQQCVACLCLCECGSGRSARGRALRGPCLCSNLEFLVEKNKDRIAKGKKAFVDSRGDAVLACAAYSTAHRPKGYQQALLKGGCMRGGWFHESVSKATKGVPGKLSELRGSAWFAGGPAEEVVQAGPQELAAAPSKRAPVRAAGLHRALRVRPSLKNKPKTGRETSKKKVRQCRMALVPLPSAHPHPRLTRPLRNLAPRLGVPGLPAF